MSAAPKSAPQAQSPAGRVAAVKVFVRGLQVEAEIGVYDHEHGRSQPLMADVELDIAAAAWDRLADTINYETIASKARAVAAEGHYQLVEAFAEKLGQSCLEDPRVTRVRVRVEKPMALAPAAMAAGAEIVLVRG
jgi:dihydroneopterin aldolase